MKVTVNENRCQGHTLCALEAPEVFLLREDDGHAYVELGDVPASLEDKVERAAQACPERAIEVIR